MLKKIIAVIITVCLIMGVFGSVAFAATPASSTYKVRIVGNTVQFITGGRVVGKYNTRDKNISVKTGRSGELIINFFEKSGRERNVTLGSQKTLDISGKMANLSFECGLNSAVRATIPSGSSVNYLTVSSANSITINGSVTQAYVTNPGAKVNIGKNAKVPDIKAPTGTVTGARPGTLTTYNPGGYYDEWGNYYPTNYWAYGFGYYDQYGRFHPTSYYTYGYWDQWCNYYPNGYFPTRYTSTGYWDEYGTFYYTGYNSYYQYNRYYPIYCYTGYYDSNGFYYPMGYFPSVNQVYVYYSAGFTYNGMYYPAGFYPEGRFSWVPCYYYPNYVNGVSISKAGTTLTANVHHNNLYSYGSYPSISYIWYRSGETSPIGHGKTLTYTSAVAVSETFTVHVYATYGSGVTATFIASTTVNDFGGGPFASPIMGASLLSEDDENAVALDASETDLMLLSEDASVTDLDASATDLDASETDVDASETDVDAEDKEESIVEDKKEPVVEDKKEPVVEDKKVEPVVEDKKEPVVEDKKVEPIVEDKIVAPEPTVTTDELDSAKTAATLNLKSVKVSKNGSDVDSAEKWVTPAVYRTYKNAINAAKEIPQLEQATGIFNAAKKDGTKDAAPKTESQVPNDQDLPPAPPPLPQGDTQQPPADSLEPPAPAVPKPSEEDTTE